MKKTLESGAELEVQLASFEDGYRLYKAVMKVLEGVSISKDEVMTLVARVSSSEDVDQALWKCMGRVTYNRVKVSKDLFEAEESRGDFLLVAKEVLWYNLTPFFKNLGSLLPEGMLGALNTQK